MSTFVKTTLLGLGLVAGIAAAAQAQSASVASLPPATAATPATAPAAPTVAYPGPNPGAGYYGGTVAQQSPVTASPQYVGPNPGAGYYGTGRNAPTANYGEDAAMHPYTSNLGPRPN